MPPRTPSVIDIERFELSIQRMKHAEQRRFEEEQLYTEMFDCLQMYTGPLVPNRDPRFTATIIIDDSRRPVTGYEIVRTTSWTWGETHKHEGSRYGFKYRYVQSVTSYGEEAYKLCNQSKIDLEAQGIWKTKPVIIEMEISEKDQRQIPRGGLAERIKETIPVFRISPRNESGKPTEYIVEKAETNEEGLVEWKELDIWSDEDADDINTLKDTIAVMTPGHYLHDEDHSV